MTQTSLFDDIVHSITILFQSDPNSKAGGVVVTGSAIVEALLKDGKINVTKLVSALESMSRYVYSSSRANATSDMISCRNEGAKSLLDEALRLSPTKDKGKGPAVHKPRTRMLTDAKLYGTIDKIDRKDVEAENDHVTQVYRMRATENLLNDHRALLFT